MSSPHGPSAATSLEINCPTSRGERTVKERQEELLLSSSPSLLSSSSKRHCHNESWDQGEWATSKHRLNQSDFHLESGSLGRVVRQTISLVWVQVVLVSLIATLTRGITNALNAVGAYGTGDLNTATACNLLSSISFSCLSWLSGAIINVVGCRTGCLLGSCTTTVLLTSLLLGAMLKKIPLWIVWIAASCDGIGSGVLWTAVGTITIKYPRETRKGFATTILATVFSTGAALGGLMAFAMNMHPKRDAKAMPDDGSNAVVPSIEDNMPIPPGGTNDMIRLDSFVIMVLLTLLGVVMSLGIQAEKNVHHKNGEGVSINQEQSYYQLERNSSRVSRYSVGSSFRLFALPVENQSVGNTRATENHRSIDNRALENGEELLMNSGRSVEFRESSKLSSSRSSHLKTALGKEFAELILTVQERAVQYLIIFSFVSLFHQTYLFNGINYATFNIRTRGLNSFMYWIGRIPTGIVHGHLVDDIRYSTRRRAFHAVTLLIVHVFLAQMLTLIFWQTVKAEGTKQYDIAEDPGNTALAFTAFFLYGGLDTASQSFALWLFSVLGRTMPCRVPHYVAIYRSFQGFGVAFAWFMDLNSFSTYQTQFIICVSCWLLSMPGLFTLLWTLPSKDVRMTQQNLLIEHLIP